MVLVFKIVGERSTAQNYCLVNLLSLFSKIFEKQVNNMVSGPRSTTDLLTVVSNRIAKAFNRSGTTSLVALFFTNSNLVEFQVRHLALFCLF